MSQAGNNRNNMTRATEELQSSDKTTLPSQKRCIICYLKSNPRFVSAIKVNGR